MSSVGPVPRGPRRGPPRRGGLGWYDRRGPADTVGILARAPGGAHSCGSAPVSHRLPPSSSRRTTHDVRVARDLVSTHDTPRGSIEARRAMLGALPADRVAEARPTERPTLH